MPSALWRLAWRELHAPPQLASQPSPSHPSGHQAAQLDCGWVVGPVRINFGLPVRLLNDLPGTLG